MEGKLGGKKQEEDLKKLFETLRAAPAPSQLQELLPQGPLNLNSLFRLLVRGAGLQEGKGGSLDGATPRGRAGSNWSGTAKSSEPLHLCHAPPPLLEQQKTRVRPVPSLKDAPVCWFPGHNPGPGGHQSVIPRRVPRPVVSLPLLEPCPVTIGFAKHQFRTKRFAKTCRPLLGDMLSFFA